jgi:hypothetical protein
MDANSSSSTLDAVLAEQQAFYRSVAAVAHGAPARVRHSAPRCAPSVTASSIEDPPARANVTPAANESPHP